jgi:uncharacterized protein YndB with AHSA1/START domain
MDPVAATTIVDRQPLEVFDYLADVANHLEFSDHYLDDFRLTREDSYGLGAGARYRVGAPLNRFGWADVTVVESQPPRRLVLRGRMGKFNRTRMVTIFTLEPGPGTGSTRVRLTTETDPKLPSDRLLEAISTRWWLKRQQRKAMKRLRSILEDGESRGARATIAGGPHKPASQYRL